MSDTLSNLVARLEAVGDAGVIEAAKGRLERLLAAYEPDPEYTGLTFQAQIQMAFRLGVICPECHSKAHLIRMRDQSWRCDACNVAAVPVEDRPFSPAPFADFVVPGEDDDLDALDAELTQERAEALVAEAIEAEDAAAEEFQRTVWGDFPLNLGEVS